MPVYLDNNASMPLDGRVLDAMMPFLRDSHGNPSSVHRYGRHARAALDQAREQVASLVGAESSQVVFTSGGTEANNFAIRGPLGRAKPGRIAISAVEHPSVMESAKALGRVGWQVDLVEVDSQGRLSQGHLGEVLARGPALVSVMTANNETGVIQDIHAISEPVRRLGGAVMHTDAVQAAGKIPLAFSSSGVHLMSLSAHKMGGPQGVGALIVDKALTLEPLLFGGAHERGARSGTENLAGIVGFGMAAALAQQELAQRHDHMLHLRQRLEEQLYRWPQLEILAAQAPRLPNTVMIAVPGIQGETLLMNLDRRGIAVSSGSACASGDMDPSHVLLAMGLEHDLARSVIRVSLGWKNTAAQVDALVGALGAELEALAAMPLSAWA